MWRRCCGSISESVRGSASFRRLRSLPSSARRSPGSAVRFSIEGVYFALLTIAFAEFTRIAFDHIGVAGGAGGFFVPYQAQRLGEWWNLRGGQWLFYYVGLALVVGAVILTAWLKGSRLGYQWLAVREDQQAARALGIDVLAAKMKAALISSAMTAVGGVFYAFYYDSLFPAQVFGIGRSIELILAPIVGGLGTVFGPVVGAFILTPLGELMAAAVEKLGVDAPGAKALFYGLTLMAIIFAASGRRVALARAHVRAGEPPGGRRVMTAAVTALLAVEGLSKRFAGLQAVDAVSFEVAPGELFAIIGPNGAGKTSLFNMIAGELAPDQGAISFAGERIEGLAPDRICRRGIGRTFQIGAAVSGAQRRGQCRHRRAACAGPPWQRRGAHAHDTLRRLDLFDKRFQRASTLTLPDRKRLEVARALATQPRLLLLDEVMAGLRPTETDRMIAILRELNRAGLTILLIEHVMRAVMALATRVLVLHHGAAIAQGPPQAVVRDPAVMRSYLGTEAVG